MLTIILFIILSLLIGSFLALLQGYLRLSKELKEKNILNQEIRDIKQKIYKEKINNA